METRQITVTEIETKTGQKKDGTGFTHYKVFDEMGLTYSGFLDPKVERGVSYFVTYELGGPDRQFKNYKTFVKSENQSTLANTPKPNYTSRADLEAKRQESIEASVKKKLAMELTKMALEQKVDVSEVVKVYKEAYKQLDEKEPEHPAEFTVDEPEVIKFDNESN